MKPHSQPSLKISCCLSVNEIWLLAIPESCLSTLLVSEWIGYRWLLYLNYIERYPSPFGKYLGNDLAQPTLTKFRVKSQPTLPNIATKFCVKSILACMWVEWDTVVYPVIHHAYSIGVSPPHLPMHHWVQNLITAITMSCNIPASVPLHLTPSNEHALLLI